MPAVPAVPPLRYECAGVPIAKPIAVVAKKTGKKFALDPRVQADAVLIGQDPAVISDSELLTIPHLHGCAAVGDGGYVQVVPDANLRTMPIPTVSDTDNRPADEAVCAVSTLKHVPAGRVVPIPRPLMLQYGHLAVSICTNSRILVDTFANVRRLEDIVRALDVGEPYKAPGCEPRETRRPRSTPARAARRAACPASPRSPSAVADRGRGVAERRAGGGRGPRRDRPCASPSAGRRGRVAAMPVRPRGRSGAIGRPGGAAPLARRRNIRHDITMGATGCHARPGR